MTAFELMMTGDNAQVITQTQHLTPTEVCRHLEAGAVIYFPQSPFLFSEEDHRFLLSQRQLEAGYHKNIAYRPLADKLTGVKAGGETDVERLKSIMRDYTRQTERFLETFLAPYKGHWQLDYGSYRPMEEQGRKLRLRARNDLLHVDSFPTRPTHGKRILRVFTNISPDITRVWRTSSTLEELLHRFKDTVKPLAPHKQGSLPGWVKSAGKLLGLKSLDRPAYDVWMLDFHNFLKENEDFQANCTKAGWEFPPGSSWMVYTDMVSHAVMSGQYALEQTYLVAPEGMAAPEKCPLTMLETLYYGVPHRPTEKPQAPVAV